MEVLGHFFLQQDWAPVYARAIARPFAILFSDARGKQSDTVSGSEELAAVLLTMSGGCSTIILASEPQVQEWTRHFMSKQIINECGALAALLGISSFASRLQNYDLMHFIDYTAAEGTLVKAYSKSVNLAAIASAYWSIAAKSNINAWIGRVPSKLNLADKPTRSDFKDMYIFGWGFVPAVMPDAEPWSMLLNS